jgi:hypothetical protein
MRNDGITSQFKESFMRLSHFVCLCIGLSFPAAFFSVQAAIPCPDSLNNAVVEVERLNDILKYALILGNGDITALLYQNGSSLELRLTKNDVWDSRLDTRKDPPLPTLKRLKELGRGRWENRKWILPADWPADGEVKQRSYDDVMPCPRACGVVRLAIHPAGKGDLSGRLDLAAATAQVFLDKAAAPIASVRALAQTNVFLIESAEAVTLEPISPKELPPALKGEKDGIHWLHQKIPGDADWPGMEFAVALARKGAITAVAIATTRETPDVVAEAMKLVKQALSADTTELIRDHESTWREFWSASGVEIDDPLMSRTWYRNVYFLRCASKPGVISPGLFAGLIDDAPAWHGDYHTNYNIQQTFWPSYVTNHPDLAEPYDRLISEYLPRAQWLAKQVYDCDGAYYPHVLFAYEPPHPETCKSTLGRQYIHHVWGMTLGVSGFTVQPLWWHYKYQPDRAFLGKTVYPPLREVTRFYLNFMDRCERDTLGKVCLGPTVSPEHRGWTENLRLNYNCAFDIAMVRYTLEAFMEAAQTLKADEDLVKRSLAALLVLPNYPTARPSKIEDEWVVDMQGAGPIGYNIAVPATPVFPCDVVSFQSPAEQRQLFARTIKNIQWNGNNSTFILAVARARLSMPRSYYWLREEILNRQRPNGTLTLNRDGDFNDFGHYTEQFAASMAISELMLQSVGDVIRIFPAWPNEKNAHFERLRTQGGFLASVSIQNGQIGPVKIESTVGGPLRLLNPWPGQTISASMADKTLPCQPDAGGILQLQTKPNDAIIISPR